MSTLSKQTKGQLKKIAEDLGIDVDDCRVKKDFYETVKQFFAEHYNDFLEGDTYYQMAHTSRLVQSAALSPRKAVVVDESSDDASKDGDSEEGDSEGGDSEEDGDSDSGSDSDSSAEKETVVAATDGRGSAALVKIKTFAAAPLAPLKSLFSATKFQSGVDAVWEANYTLRAYLSEPFILNNIVILLESLYLVSQYYRPSTVGALVPQVAKDKLSDVVLEKWVPTIDASGDFISTTFVWLLFSAVLPAIVSYYVNFTYDYLYDSFVYALSRFFLAVVLFKADLPKGIPKDLAGLAGTCEFVKFSALNSAYLLRSVFGNWVLIDALFLTILSLYANLAFI